MKKCKNCVSRYICVFAKKEETCLGFDEEALFWGNMRLLFPEANIDNKKDLIKQLQEEAAERREDE